MVSRVLLHLCCGPCTLYPLKVLREEGLEPVGFFYNPNIHPYREFRKRMAALREVSQVRDLEVIWHRHYGLRDFLREVVFREEDRCEVCYWLRLRETARLAREGGFEVFTTTLLYSPFQKHELLREIGEALARRFGLTFLYRDFREGWRKGQEEARQLGIYRQAYCGCIFSEQERYDKKWRRRRA
ncbi:epoxyqueuosine reductase QueH [Thermosulfurimonas marina]|uniref:Epoxyqueuosine reductase QueH n=1 Tax=Thermosulfurimonas marina TaxID=2047767 RepID=A0A6H1WSM9_9BACT|nr:epoxyqueuosine reductase QueH [Thermosulfurimonas marina]QJA06227.1 epoxyqueuosine reductase QueH [Thermosulfurimonas marina]